MFVPTHTFRGPAAGSSRGADKAPVADADRAILGEVIVDAKVSDVWKTWTTEESE